MPNGFRMFARNPVKCIWANHHFPVDCCVHQMRNLKGHLWCDWMNNLPWAIKGPWWNWCFYLHFDWRKQRRNQ
jgi:hypothetical protein